MIDFEIDRPMPVPTPTGLVVKYDSKMRDAYRFRHARPVILDRETGIAAIAAKRANLDQPVAADAGQRVLAVDEEIGGHLRHMVGVGHGQQRFRWRNRLSIMMPVDLAP